VTRRLPLGGSGILASVLFGALVLGRLAIDPLTLRIAMTAVSIPLVIALGFRSPRQLLFTLVCWLAVLGTVRRMVGLAAGSSKADVLLLIAPVALGVLVLVAGGRGAFRDMTPLSKSVLGLCLLVLLSALNPLQGGLLAGVAGLLFVLVPMLGFWIGRGLCDDETLRKVFVIVAGFSLLNGLYGLAQTFIGFPSWDQAWIDQAQYDSLNVGGLIRPFASLSSAAEFAYYTGLGIIIWGVLFLMSRRAVLAALTVIPILVVALAYESARSPVIFLAAALGLVFAARRGLGLVPAIGSGLALVAVLFVAAGHFAGSASSSSPLLAHQVSGLSNPTDPNSSTAPGHLNIALNGLTSVTSNPLGSGAGATTLAGARFGGVRENTELDPSNVAVGLGIPGLIVYALVLSFGLIRAYSYAARRRDALSLVVLGVVVLTSAHWLNGGQYAVSVLPWLALGWLDAQET
jgi:hypothetical protein